MIRPAAEDGWNCLDLRRVAIAPDKGNAELTKDSAALPPHIEDTVQAIAAHSGDLERSFRSIMNTDSGDHEHPHEPARAGAGERCAVMLVRHH
jgi:hypothetical protein